jgi:signal transduction histidine kinase
MISDTGAEVHVQNLPVIEAIPFQMGQLFQNFLSNAIKFRKPEITPMVYISAEVMNANELFMYADETNIDHQGHWQRERIVRITITDNGIGFDESYKEKVFEIFQRLHSNKLYEGTGIGLAICKKIVDNHHGSIQVISKPDKGTTFTITLPVSQEHFK